MRIFCLFNLKQGVAPEEYEAWARDTDLPGANALGSVDRFSVHRATGLFGAEGKPPYDYIEVIDITGMDSFIADVSDPAFQRVAAKFGEFADNPQFVLTQDL